MAPTDIQITNAKPREQAYKLADSEGLHLVVKTNGAKLWRMNYRYLGHQKTLYLGAWPVIGLAAAREQRDEARKNLAVGLDPAAEKRIANLARKIAADNTCKTIAEEWLSKNEREGRAAICKRHLGGRAKARPTAAVPISAIRHTRANGRSVGTAAEQDEIVRVRSHDFH